MSYSVFPILKEFDRNFVKKGNHLRDKYPDVAFKDEDIDWYDYESNEPEAIMMEQFLEQYNVKNLLITTDFGKGKIHKYYLKGVKLKIDDNKYYLQCEKSLKLENNGFEIKYDDLKEDFHTLKQSEKIIDNNFRLYMFFHGDAKLHIEINPDLTVLDDYVSYFVDELLNEYNDESVIYKHPNGIQYYTETECIFKGLTTYIREDDSKTIMRFRIYKHNVVEPFKKYNDEYNVRSMPAKSKQITLEQMKMEFKSLCYHVIKNKIKLTERKWYYAEHLKPLFKGQNLLFYYNCERDNYKDDFEITSYEPKRKKDVSFKNVSIKKKDKHIGNFETFDDVDQSIKDDITKYITEKIGDDFDLVFSDLEVFVSELDLDIEENEEYSGDYFYYDNAYSFGKYTLVFNSSKYIKDQCICDLQLDSIDIYEIK